MCYDDTTDHSQRLAAAASGSSTSVEGGGSRLRTASGDKWKINWEDVTIEEGNLLGQGGFGVVYKGTYKVRRKEK